MADQNLDISHAELERAELEQVKAQLAATVKELLAVKEDRRRLREQLAELRRWQ